MARIEHSVVINRPAEEIWAFMADSANSPQWISGLVESRQVSDGPMGSGTTIRNVGRLLGRQIESTYEITEWEPYKRGSVKSTSGPIPFEGTRTFESEGGGTRITEVVDAQIGGFLRLAEPVIARMMKRQIEADYAKLKDLLEARA